LTAAILTFVNISNFCW